MKTLNILESTPEQRMKVRKYMFNKINDFYSNGCIQDTGIYEKFSLASDFEVEKEFKAIYKAKTNNSYFGA